MPTDNRVIPQDKIDLTRSLLVDAHSLKALPFTQDYSSTLSISESNLRARIHNELEYGLALANIIQNIVLYDTVIADSLLLQTEPGVQEAFNLFPGIIKGAYLEGQLRHEIGRRVYTVVPIWDINKRPRIISDEHWNHIQLLENRAKPLMDRMTKVVPNLVPPEFEQDDRRQWQLMKLERDAKETADPFLTSYENLPDCCVSSSTGLARTHYYLELARELSIPLSVHPIRSSYFEALTGEYQKEYEEYSLKAKKEAESSKTEFAEKGNVQGDKNIFQRISGMIKQRNPKDISDEKWKELIAKTRQIDEMNEREKIVAYAEDVILKDAIEESGAPISLKLTIPAVAELVMSYAAQKVCPIHEAVIEVRQSKNATKFREWCQIYTEASMKGRPGIKEQTELFKEFKNVCEIWQHDIREEVDYKTRKITLEKIPIIGGTLQSLNMDKLSVRDRVLVPRKNVSYFLLLNDLYRLQPKNLY
ncbi:MAG: hypothetical protein ACRCZS_17460 [Chroococcidiopsis sp.]